MDLLLEVRGTEEAAEEQEDQSLERTQDEFDGDKSPKHRVVKADSQNVTDNTNDVSKHDSLVAIPGAASSLVTAASSSGGLAVPSHTPSS